MMWCSLCCGDILGAVRIATQMTGAKAGGLLPLVLLPQAMSREDRRRLRKEHGIHRVGVRKVSHRGKHSCLHPFLWHDFEAYLHIFNATQDVTSIIEDFVPPILVETVKVRPASSVARFRLEG